MNKPVAIFYAGANGAGKSTLRDDNPHDGEMLKIDPDAIARQINPDDPRSVDMAAGRQASQMFTEAIKNKQSFSMESTLTGHSVLARMVKAKQAGFEIKLYYVGLHSADRNVNRVAARVKKGGHHIDEDVIRKRYSESLENLPKALAIADNGRIYSNDRLHKAEYSFDEKGLVRRVENPVQWAQNAIKAQDWHVERGLQHEAREGAAVQSDKAKVAEAVASAFIDSKVKDLAQREALKAAVGARMAERNGDKER